MPLNIMKSVKAEQTKRKSKLNIITESQSNILFLSKLFSLSNKTFIVINVRHILKK